MSKFLLCFVSSCVLAVGFFYGCDHDEVTLRDIDHLQDLYNLRNLTNTNFEDEMDPSWSPDGRNIAFATYNGITVMDADGKNRVALTSAVSCSPSWSPDSQRIAFYSNRDGNGEIYIMDANGENQQNLTKSHIDETEPSWSPDGRRIAFVSDDSISVMDADGKNRRILVEVSGWICNSPTWSPDGQSIAFSSRYEPENYEFWVKDIWVIDYP